MVAGPGREDTPVVQDQLMERVLGRDNLRRAFRQVKRNKGSAGIDGMTVDELSAFVQQHWPRIAAQLLAGDYRPQPVRQLEVPKPKGGARKLGIPTVLDRLIQQALLQVFCADGLPHLRQKPAFRTTSTGKHHRLLIPPVETGGERAKECCWSPLGAHVPGVHVHSQRLGKAAQSERRCDPAVQVSRSQDHPAHAGSNHPDGDRRVGGVPEGLERLLRFCASEIADPGPGEVGSAQATMLSPEAVGSIRLSPIAQARRERTTGLEHGQVRSWPVVFEPESGAGASLAKTVLSVVGGTGPC